MKRLLIFCTLLISSSVFAEPSLPYINVNLIYGALQTPNEDYSPYSSYPNTSHQLGGIGYGINAGYLFDSYQFSLPYEWRLGAEAGFNQFADNTYTYGFSSSTNNIKYGAYALSFLGVIRYQNDEHWLAFFKTGVARVVQAYKPSIGTSNNPTQAAFEPQFTLGGGYQLTQNLDADLSYNYILGKAPSLGNNDTVAPVSYLAFTLGYSF